jgi:hypothetical protein
LQAFIHTQCTQEQRQVTKKKACPARHCIRLPKEIERSEEPPSDRHPCVAITHFDLLSPGTITGFKAPTLEATFGPNESDHKSSVYPTGKTGAPCRGGFGLLTNARATRPPPPVLVCVRRTAQQGAGNVSESKHSSQFVSKYSKDEERPVRRHKPPNRYEMVLWCCWV